MKKFLLLIILLNSYFFNSAQITLTTFATGLSSPIGVMNAGDDRIFVIQRTGLIKIYDLSGTFIGNFINLSSLLETGYGEQGLLGLAFDPNYSTNGFFYVDYTALSPIDGETHISRFKVSANPNVADATSEQVLLRIYQPQVNHNGGNIVFGPDGYLYIGMGDGGGGGDQGTGHNATYGNAQSKDSLLGKILRIDVSDTTVLYRNPPTNPFYGAIPGRDEIWAWGVRNPWRWSFDRWNGDWWLGDVGQDTWEEVDYWKAGSPNGVNYGWRCYEGNAAYNTLNCGSSSNYTFPIRVYNHSTGALAIIGGYVYRGAEFSNLWAKYFYSDEATSSIGVHSITHVGASFLDSLALSHGGTFVSFGEDKYGELYIADIGGTIYKFQGATCSPEAIIHFTDTIINCLNTPLNFYTPNGRGFHYQWTMNSSPIGSDSSGLTVTAAGDYSVTATDRNTCTAVSTIVHVSNAVPPIVTISGTDTMYCSNDPAIAFAGNPSGGIFSGPGMAGNTFTPANATVGYDTISYSYTDPSTFCSDSSTAIIHIVAPPTVSISGADTMYCVYNSSIPLTGNPSGGTFSGPGMTGDSFNPATAGIGYDTITYAYTDTITGCSNSTTAVIHVDACFGIDEHSSVVSLSLYPNPNTGNFTLSMVVRNEENLNLEISDVLGKVISEKQIAVHAGNNSIEIKNTLAKGAYMLRLKGKDVSTRKSFVVK
jgi:glucose/arabinose dehydrogenase